MELAGCATFSDNKALSFDLDWPFEDVDNFLRNLLPHPFEYADANISRSGSKAPADKAKPVWVLLSKEQRRLAVVPGVMKPTGKDLERFKGRDGASTKDSHIFVGK